MESGRGAVPYGSACGFAAAGLPFAALPLLNIPVSTPFAIARVSDSSAFPLFRGVECALPSSTLALLRGVDYADTPATLPLPLSLSLCRSLCTTFRSAASYSDNARASAASSRDDLNVILRSCALASFSAGPSFSSMSGNLVLCVRAP